MTNSVETFIANELANRRAAISIEDRVEARTLINNTIDEVLEHRRYPAQSVRDNGNAAYSMFHGDCHVLFNGVMGGAGITLLQCEQIDALRFDVERVAKFGLGGFVTETLRQIADCISFGSKSEKELWLLDRSIDSVVLVGDDRYDTFEAEFTGRGCVKPEPIAEVKARKLQEIADEAQRTATVDGGYDDAEDADVPEWMLAELGEQFTEMQPEA
jgi:hypothetical protein